MLNLNTTLKLDGEKEYRNAIKDVNKELKTLGTEMGLVSEKFGKNTTSTEALSAKNKTLEKQIDATNRKLESAKSALQNAQNATEKNADSINYWQQQVNRAETDLLKLQHAHKKNTDALKESTAQTDQLTQSESGLGDALNALGEKFGLSLPAEMTTSLNGMMALNAGALVAIAGFAALVAGVIKVEEALVNLTKQQSAAADEILTSSVKYGIATDTLQEWNYAAELVDVSVDTMTSSMTKMIRTMNTARDGGNDAAAAYAALGVQITDSGGQLRDSQDVFYEVIDALGAVANETERDALSMQIFGKSAMELNPLIVSGTDALKDYAKEAREMGYVLTDEQLAALGEVDNAQQRYNNSLEAAKNMIAVEFAPYLESFLESFSQLWPRVASFLADSGIIDLFGTLMDIVAALEPAFEILADVLGGEFGNALSAICLPLALVADALNVVLSAIGAVYNSLKALFALIGGNKDDLSHAVARVSKYSENISGVFDGSNSALARAIGGSNIPAYASGTLFHPGGLARVGEFGEETVVLPRGAQVYPHGQEPVSTAYTYNRTTSMNINSMGTFIAVTQRMEQERRAIRQGRVK